MVELHSTKAAPRASNLAAGLIHHSKAATLVTQTLGTGRAAGPAVWPQEIAGHVHAYARRMNIASQPPVGGDDGRVF